MNISKLLYLNCCLLIIACSNQSKKHNDIDVIDIPNALDNLKDVNLSQFVKSIEFVLLEETDKTMLFLPTVEVTEDFIIARNSGPSAMGPILLFDRKTGKFIRGIGKSGRGPGEFYYSNYPFYNIYSKRLYGVTYSHDEIVEYDLKGNFLGNIKVPQMIDNKVNPRFGTPGIHLDQYLNKDIFVSSIENTTGWDKRRIVIYSRDSVLNIFPNYLFWKRESWNFLNSLGSAYFFRWKDQLSIKEPFNDTIFQITKNSLIPKFVFKTSEHTPGPELMEQRIDPSVLAKYYFIRNILENDDYLFFQLDYQKNYYTCVFDKKIKSTVICKIHDGNKSGILDDINGFIALRPLRITQNNEMIFKLEADEIMEWKKSNPAKKKSIGKKLEWIDSISTGSNPVIVIAHM